MKRAWAAIDIGTNSVRLLLRRQAGQAWEEEKRVCITRLGQGLSQKKHLCEEAMARTESAVIEFAKYAVAKGALRPVWCYATSAARQADNGIAFLQRLTDSGWVAAELLSGEDEAKATYYGCQANGRPVLDVGGGSTELTMEAGGVLNGKSIPLGCVTLTEEFLKHDPIQKDEAVALLDHCKEQTSVLASEILQGKAKEMMAVGGTATQLAMLELGLPVYQSDKVHGFLLSYEMIHAWYHRLTAMQREERKRLPGMEAKRADVVVCGAAVIASVMENAQTETIIVSDKDGLDGYLQSKLETILDK